jgi:competence protein ComEC
VLVLGQRSAADARLNDAFQRAGGVHFLSVGGFHIGILAGFVWGILRLIVPRARKTASWITLAVTLLYLVLAEPTAPALRGVIGVLLGTVAVLLGRPVTAMNWLMSAAFIILFLNPHDLFQASFQLSFMLVLALLLWVTPLWDALRARSADIVTWRQWVAWRARRAALGLVMATGVCFVAALPLTLFHFQRVALWGLLGSILLTPLVSLTIILSFITIAASALPGPVGGWLGAALAVVTKVLLALVDLLGRLPAAVIHTPQPPAWLVIFSIAAALVAELLRRRTAAGAAGLEDDDAIRAIQRRARGRFAAFFGVMLVFWLFWGLTETAPVRHGHIVRFLAVGDGSATTFVPSHGRAAVFDAGSAENLDVGAIVARSLRCDRVRGIDWVLVSHANFDHYSGLPALAEQMSIQRVASGPYFERAGCRASDAGRLARRFARPMWALAAGDRAEIGGGTIEILWPPADLPAGTSANDTSLVARWTAGGVRVLLTGDIEEVAIRALLARQAAGAVDLRADVLVAPHHGEVIPRLTDALVAAVSPHDVVVSSQRVRARLDALIARSGVPAIRVHQTARDGCVTLRIADAGGYTIEFGADP